MSVPAFRDKVLSNKGAYSSTTVKRANLAKTLSGMRKGEDGMEMDTLPKVKAIDPLNLAAKTTLNNLEAMPKGGSPKVKAYQEMLRSKGYNIVADGAWGTETQKAYESYIKSKTMSSAPKAAAKTTSTSSSQNWNYTPAQWDKSMAENKARPVANSVMSTANNLKKTPITTKEVLRTAEPTKVTQAMSNVSKYKKAVPAAKSNSKMSANEALVRRRVSNMQSGKSIYRN
jgi:hypothetical protein